MAGTVSNHATEPARTSTWDAGLDGYGSTHMDTLPQSVTLPTGCSSYRLSFWLHIDTAETTTSTEHDTLKVQMLKARVRCSLCLRRVRLWRGNAGRVGRQHELIRRCPAAPLSPGARAHRPTGYRYAGLPNNAPGARPAACSDPGRGAVSIPCRRRVGKSRIWRLRP
jgi:hypothetical protein